MKQQDIDILLSDIKMPRMIGLELAEQAKQINPAIKIVFISGYDDFEYVKIAVKINAYEYILKPVRTVELTACIQKVVEDIAEETRERQGKNDLLNIVNESKPLLKKKYLLDLIYGLADKDSTAEKTAKLDVNIGRGPKGILLLEIDDFKMVRESETEESISKEISELHSTVTDSCSIKQFCCTAIRSKDSGSL